VTFCEFINVRHAKLNSILKKRLHNTNQQIRLEHLLDLSRSGVDSENLWEVYGSDIILDIHGLKDLESFLAKSCNDKLLQQFLIGDLEKVSLEKLQKFLIDCRKKIVDPDKVNFFSPKKLSETKDVFINREDEVSKILNFFDHPNEFLLEVSGLPQIGKTSIISNSLDRTNIVKIKKIPLLNTSSVEYIIAEITESPIGLHKDNIELLNILKDALKNWDTIWFENTQDLLVSRQWKSPEIERLINDFVSIALSDKSKTKIIFESSSMLPLKLNDPSLLNKLKIGGFERTLLKHGIAILDRQMRRLDLNPNDISDEIKAQLTKDLGGHPLAIIFCADAICEEGLETTISALKKGVGFYREVTDRIVNVFTLSKEDTLILRLLSGCRIEVPRDVIANTCKFPATEYISNLGRQCLIEIVSPTTIRLPGVLRNRFRFNSLDEETKHSLHKNAAVSYNHLAKLNPSQLEYAVEAEYHSAAIGEVLKDVTGLIDGQVAAIKKFYDDQNYEMANKLIKPLITEKSSLDLIRLSTLIDVQLGNLDKALINAKKVLTINPSDNHLFFVLGKAALTQSRPEYGDKIVSIGRVAGVLETKVSLLEGRIYLRRRDFGHAKDCFKQAIRSAWADPWAYYYLGTTYMRMGDFPEAINILYEGEKYVSDPNRKIRGNVKNAIRTKLGAVYVLNGDLEPASKILEYCLETDPDHPETLYTFWLLKVRKEGVEKVSEAFEVFKKAKPKRWEMGQYHLYYGLFYKAIDNLKDANEQFALAYKSESSNVYIMIQYADSLYSLALLAKRETEIELSKNRAIKCAYIVKRIFEFDPDNQFAENIQIDLYSEFDIQLSKLE